MEKRNDVQLDSDEAPAPYSQANSADYLQRDPESEKIRILRERARNLAKRPVSDELDAECLSVIEFMLAHERYAMEMSFVREVYPLRDLTPVPCTPSFILGIINVRGQVVSVMDMKEFFDLPRSDPSDQHRVLIVKSPTMELGILADSVLGERRIPVEDIQSDLAAFASTREGYIRGVTKDRVIVMDMGKILEDGGIVVHHEVGD
jgi:purine-binding chemotaxis protein CheW